MRYLEKAIGSAYIPKLLGIYERELHGVVERIRERRPDRIVVAGGGEGYYVVGLGMCNPEAYVIAFEAAEEGPALILELARLNRTEDRLSVHTFCNPKDLENSLHGCDCPAVICDVEGYEDTLLNPDLVPNLHVASILVELHEFCEPGVGRRLRERFKFTHLIEEILEQDRSIAEFPYRTFGTWILPKSYLTWAVSEWRPERMSWLWMTPR